MEINSLVVGPLGVNCYIISERGKAVIVDPGGNFEEICGLIDKNRFVPLAIVNTHAHFDHIGAVSQLVEKFDIPFYLHKDDEFLAGHGSETSVMFGFAPNTNPKVTNYLKDGQKLNFDSIEIEVLHTPGHSPGGVSLYVRELGCIMTGDTLFLESVGRSDFPYASSEQLLKSIRTKLMALDPDIKVLPGHGPFSSIGHEKSYNPFL